MSNKLVEKIEIGLWRSCLIPKFNKKKNKKMSNENLPSITTRTDGPDDERISVNKEKDIALFAKTVDGMVDFTRIENGEFNKIDLEGMIEKTEKIVLNKKKDVKVKKYAHDTIICGYL